MQSRRFLKGVGNYRVSLAAVAVCAGAFSLGAAEVLQDSSENSPDKVYVSSSGSNTSPYNTWETAAHNIKDAIDAVNGENADAPGIVYLAPGTYTASSGCSADGNYLVSVEKSVRLVGTGDKPDETVLDGEGTRRVLSLTGKGSGVENIMIARARTSSTIKSGTEIGFGLNMVNAGIVDNCIISNAVTTGSVEGSIETWVYVNGGIITNSVICNGSLLKVGRCIVLAKGVIGSTKIHGNVSLHKNGGVVTVLGANSYLVDCDIYSNQDQMREYGVCCGIVSARSGAKVLSCRIFNNTAIFNRSGCYLGMGINAASAENTGGMNIKYSQIYGNVLIDKCIVTNNTMTAPGISLAGSYFKNGSAVLGVLLGYKTTLRNSLIANNSVTPNKNGYFEYDISGGVTTMRRSGYYTDSIIESCTIVGNSSLNAPSKGGVYLPGSFITNSIVCNNGGQRNNSQPWIDGNILLAGTATASYCLTKGKDEVGEAVAGEGNLAGDPLLNADYTLSRTSPAVNAGLNQDWMKGETDLSGKKRISGGKVDLGCYERFMQGFSISIR